MFPATASEREVVVYDEAHPCSYLPGRTAVLPLRFQRGAVSPAEFDDLLAAGDRRTGRFLYRTQCPVCRACEPIRLDLATFRPNETQRREYRRGELQLAVVISEPVIDQERIDLFNVHRRERGMESDGQIDEAGYVDFLTNSCCQTWELSYYAGSQLVAVAIADAGASAVSAVYCYYDPHYRGVSLGTYSVLKLAEIVRHTDRRYLYLGFYIAESPHMSYKARFHPHQRLTGGQWREFA